MNTTAPVEPARRPAYVLPVLIVAQFLLTIGTLALILYFKLISPPSIEYPIVIVDPSIEGKYADKFKGKVTVFDLEDISRWHYFNDLEASESAHTGVSFIYPPNFEVTTGTDGSFHLSQNRKDFLVISPADQEFTEADMSASYETLSFGKDNKFYQYKNGTADQMVTLYQGAVNGYGLTVVDTEAFSPEVVYLILMSMEYQSSVD